MHRYTSRAALILHLQEEHQLRIRKRQPRKETYGFLSLDSKIRPAIEARDKDRIALVMAWAFFFPRVGDRGAPSVGPDSHHMAL